MVSFISPAAFTFGALALSSLAVAQDADRDGDGITDFHETHKYLTDPDKADSDGDGIDDGEGNERREFQYVVRTRVLVMKPVTIEYLNDDYQDARLLRDYGDHVELEVFHYPFNTVSSAIGETADWQERAQSDSTLQRWLAPGPSSDWTPELAEALREELLGRGVDLDKVSDREAVEQVAACLFDRAEFHDGFSTFATAFDDSGKPYIPAPLAEKAGDGSQLEPQEQFEREISAAGMFRNKVHGSCTSAAIYVSGCMRAAGIPTRTVLCIPLIDANDDEERNMLKQLSVPWFRESVEGPIQRLDGSWASHTFNEVYVGGRWHRLNYRRLGQNVFDPGLFGLMTHVATFHDWADAQMPETVGKRQVLKAYDDVFGGPNPYSTLELSDQIGPHCRLSFPEPGGQAAIINSLSWTDDTGLPAYIRENCVRTGRFGLIAEIGGLSSAENFASFLNSCDLAVTLESPGQPVVKSAFDKGCYWITNDTAMIYIPVGKADRGKLAIDVPYRLIPVNGKSDFRWTDLFGKPVIRGTR